MLLPTVVIESSAREIVGRMSMPWLLSANLVRPPEPNAEASTTVSPGSVAASTPGWGSSKTSGPTPGVLVDESSGLSVTIMSWPLASQAFSKSSTLTTCWLPSGSPGSSR